jgi:hypothetical protein
MRMWVRIPQDGKRGYKSTDKENLALAADAAGRLKQVNGSEDVGLNIG